MSDKLPRPEKRTHCPQGHEYTPENTLRSYPSHESRKNWHKYGKQGSRHCRECRRGRDRYKRLGWDTPEIKYLHKI